MSRGWLKGAKVKIELNLWFSSKSGNIYGNLNINHKEQIENIDKLLSIQQFCNYTINKKLTTEDFLCDFINDPNRDHNALYAWTNKNNIVSWNTNNKFALIIYQDQTLELKQNKSFKLIKGQPDVCFRNF